MDDTIECNKLCSLCGGPKATFVCHICNCSSTFLDEPCTVIALEDKREKIFKGEKIPPKTFMLTDAKEIEMNCSKNTSTGGGDGILSMH